jgi:DNA polymerase-3 subunit epsilon
MGSSRMNKMNSVNDFIALDVETASADFASICSIGLVHFRGGAVFRSLNILVDPEDRFDPVNISIHGIRPEDVAGKQTMAQVLPVISASLNDTVVVHHSPFDKTALNRAAVKYGAQRLSCSWLDTIRVARRAWPQYAKDGGYGLANLATAFGIDFSHHNAAEDARAAGEIMLKALTEGQLSLLDWLDRVEQSVSVQPSGERAQLARSGNPAGPLFGEVVVFTGTLGIPRLEAAAMAASAGCSISNTVNKATTILMVGDQDLRYTQGEEKSAKHRKVETMIRDGANIRIVGESDFMLMVQA